MPQRGDGVLFFCVAGAGGWCYRSTRIPARSRSFSTCVDAVVGMPVYLGWKLNYRGYQPSALIRDVLPGPGRC